MKQDTTKILLDKLKTAKALSIPILFTIAYLIVFPLISKFNFNSLYEITIPVILLNINYSILNNFLFLSHTYLSISIKRKNINVDMTKLSDDGIAMAVFFHMIVTIALNTKIIFLIINKIEHPIILLIITFVLSYFVKELIIKCTDIDHLVSDIKKQIMEKS